MRGLWPNSAGAESEKRKGNLILGGAVVQAFAQFLAGAEEGNTFFANGYSLARAWVTSLPRRPHFYRESAKAAKFHPITAGQSRRNFIEHGRNYPLYVAVIEIWITLREPHHQFGFDHFATPGTASHHAASLPDTLPNPCRNVNRQTYLSRSSESILRNGFQRRRVLARTVYDVIHLV
jgi:hypothetical protein